MFPPSKIELSEEDIARFWTYVSKGSTTECWLWTGSRLSVAFPANGPKVGYGRFNKQYRTHLAHRVSWVIAFGDPGALFVLHRCDTPLCVNPAHLWLGTHKDNSDDKVTKGRGRGASGDTNGSKTHPESFPRGVSHYTKLRPEKITRGENCHSAKLSNESVLEIKRLLALGTKGKNLAEKYGVSRDAISCIKTGKTWRHLK